MTVRYRYTLIALGIATFLILAPSLLLYVQGKRWTTKPTQSPKTGIISIETDPSNATVFVNSAEELTTPGAVRFLPTGRYDTRITKAGYKAWQKTLSVIAGRVTHANPNPAKLALVKDTQPQTIATNVTHAASSDERIAYTTTGKKLVITDRTGSTAESTTLPAEATILQTGAQKNQFIVTGPTYAWVVAPNTTPVQLPTSFSEGATLATIDAVVHLSPTGELLYTTLAQPNDVKTLARKVRGFTLHNSDIYYLTSTEPQQLLLMHGTLKDGAIIGMQEFSTNLNDAESSLFLDEGKSVYILQGTTLYRLAENAKQIATGVSSASTASGNLTYATPSEFWSYSSTSDSSSLISRSSQPFRAYLITPNKQYVLAAPDKELVALEINAEFGQNRYTLDTATDTLTPISFMQNTHALYLSGTTLKLIELF